MESEHRTLARDIGDLVPADNVAYEAALLARSNGGFLSPKKGNEPVYKAIRLRDLHGVTNTKP